MKEKDVIPEFVEKIRGAVDELWSYKIPDNKHTGRKPFDVVAVYRKDGKTVPLALEFKIHKNSHIWPCDSVTPFQEKSLSDFAAAGGDARIVLNIRFVLTPTERDKLDPTGNIRACVWVVWSIDEWLAYKVRNTHVDVKALLKKVGTRRVDDVEGRSL